MNKSDNMSSAKKVIIKPIIISGKNKRSVVLAPQRIKPSLILSNLKLAKGPIFQEDVIYESSNCDFLKGESQQVLIVNKVNITTKTCRTIAKCTLKGVCVETTSDDVCALIGQNNYDTVLSALSSLFNQETKVRGILALLKTQTKYRTTATQTDIEVNSIKNECVDSSSQTVESNIQAAMKQKQRKRIRRQQFTPYVVKVEKEVKKCIINIDNVCKKQEMKKEIKDEEDVKLAELPELKTYVDEDSNFSCGSIGNMSSISSTYMPDFIGPYNIEANTQSSINKVTCTWIKVYDGTNIMIPVKPEDEFHIATREILKNVTREERIKLLCHQAFIDFKMCLEQNEDGYYPLHIAVLHSDHDLVRRQCLALRARRESVDKMAGGMTALQMSIRHNSSPDCTLELVRRGADPLLGDAERRSALHHAAAAAHPAHLMVLLAHCDTQARQVLKNNQNFWKPELEDMSEKDLVKYLYEKIGELFDDQGDTPLMVAARSGRADAALPLAARAPALVDAASPACGATALYRAVAAACLHAAENGNRTVVPDHFLRTAEVLVGHGADPTAENHSGSSVNSLLQEYNLPPLSMVIANKMSAMNHGKLASNMILVKDREGRIAPEQTNKRKMQDMLTKIKNVLEIPKESKTKVVDVKRKQEETTDSSIKETKYFRTSTFVKNDTNVLKIPTDKFKFATIDPNKMCPNEPAKVSSNRQKIVIVENVCVKTDFSKIHVPSAHTVVSKPKDIVLVTTKKDHQLQRSPNLQNSPKYVKIAPKPMIVRQDESVAGTITKTKSDEKE